MNLFILDEDIDRCAEYHIDKHVTKMILEAAQLLSTALWVDKIVGFVPRALNSKELDEVKKATNLEPAIEERTFIRYLATHHNHPCAIWTRSSLDNYEWVQVYANALNEEAMWRGYKSHASCIEVNRMPAPINIKSLGLTSYALAMPNIYKTSDAIESYRSYYRNDKAAIASWKNRGAPEWWYNDTKKDE